MLTRKMKDSGIEWIGEIPEDWDARRIKNILSERNLKNDPVITNVVLSLLKDRGVIPYSEKGNIGNKAKEDITKYKVAYPKDIIMNSMNVIIGSVNISRYIGVVSPVYYVLYVRDENEHDIDYINMLFQTKQFQESLKGIGNGILEHRMRIPINKLNDVILPFPSKKEQTKIVGILKRKTRKLDNIINETQQSIEELKKYKQSLITEAVTKGLDPNVEMKDSGIEWIGKIPKHWTVSKVKQFYEVVSGGTPKSNNISYWNGDIVWITPSDYQEDDVYVAKSNRTISMEGVQNSSAEIVPRNSIIVSNRAPIGKIVLTDIELSTNQGCKAMVNKKNINNKFIYYFMYIMQEVLEEFGHGTTFRELSTEALKNFKFPVPFIEEQRQIVSYLDEQTSRIDKLIADKTTVIKELESYKKSLIYEYVTGKKEV